MKDFHKLLEVINKDDPKYVAETLLLEIIDLSEAKNAAVYFLNLLNNKFEKVFFYAGEELRNSYTVQDVRQIPIFKKAVVDLALSQNHKTIIVPIVRKTDYKNFCIGFIYVEGFEKLSEDFIDFLYSTSLIYDQVVRSIFVNNLLANGNQPLSFKKSRDDYFKDLIKLVLDASKLPVIVLREFDASTNGLLCIDYAGLDNYVPPDYSDKDWPPIYKSVVESQKSQQGTYRDSKELKPETFNGNVSQYVVLPIVVGEDLWGIMTLATKTEYYFTDSEMLGYATIAHSIGISINNFRNFHSGSTKLMQYANNAALVTGLEIAQSVRHEAKNLLNEAQFALAILQRNLDKKYREEIDELSLLVSGITKALDKIKTATRPPERILSKVSLQAVWGEALDMLRGRLDEQNVRIKVNGSLNVQINAYQDWLRHAFMNLVTNSVDAYKDRGSKKNREIVLTVAETNDKIQLTYADLAGGIEIQNLEFPDSLSIEIRRDMNRLIFEPNVTSKGDEGSGFGLYLTRLTIQDYHGGTINLTNHRNGVTFNIELPKNLK